MLLLSKVLSATHNVIGCSRHLISSRHKIGSNDLDIASLFQFQIRTLHPCAHLFVMKIWCLTAVNIKERSLICAIYGIIRFKEIHSRFQIPSYQINAFWIDIHSIQFCFFIFKYDSRWNSRFFIISKFFHTRCLRSFRQLLLCLVSLLSESYHLRYGKLPLLHIPHSP